MPNEKIRLPSLEVHFGVGGCGRTVSTGGEIDWVAKGRVLNGLGWSKCRVVKGEGDNWEGGEKGGGKWEGEDREGGECGHTL